MKAFRTAAMALLIGTVAALGYGLQTGARAQEDPNREAEQQKEPEARRTMMMCPMMTGLKGVELHADSPALLAARADELNLTDEQKEQLREISERAREQAGKLLTEKQREQLADAPEGPLSPMEIARMRMKKGGDQEDGQMCPMCMRMMHERMRGKNRPGRE